MLINILFTSIILLLELVQGLPTFNVNQSRDVSQSLFNSLEELARIVDISYCVGLTGIQKPFQCLSRCRDFEGFELVTTWNTGPLLSDSCGFIAISHPPHPKRVIVAFRGTYSIANTIADLSTNPAEYAPFPSDDDNDSICMTASEHNGHGPLIPQFLKKELKRSDAGTECMNCIVHGGFMTSWRNTRCIIVPHVEDALRSFPDYELTLVGHSLGGAVATLAALEFQARGWTPHVTTFGEPRLGNKALNEYIDQRFNLTGYFDDKALFRRVTHVSDPVPLLPLEEWGYHMHSGEIFISKSGLPPIREDLEHCNGEEDPACIADGPAPPAFANPDDEAQVLELEDRLRARGMWTMPPRYRLWELFFAHRDYFWRLGLCVPGGDPWNWSKEKYESMLDMDLSHDDAE